MAPAILLVDDQRDILRLLHSALDTLRNPELEVLEAASAEAALEALVGRRVDLLVTDYNLPGMTGTELIRRARAEHAELGVILITGNTDRKVREEMLEAGAVGIFSKPVPLGDFLDAVERGLGLQRTILPSDDASAKPQAARLRISELLANLRRDLEADAAFLINQRGLVVERAGDLRDRSMEVSLLSALTAVSASGLKIAASNHEERLEHFSVFAGGDHDLILMQVDASYTLLLAGNGLSERGRLLKTLQAIGAARNDVAKGLLAIGAGGPVRKKRGKTGELAKAAPELEALLAAPTTPGVKPEELDAYWDAAAAQHANQPMSKDVISFEEARKMGLTPEDKAE